MNKKVIFDTVRDLLGRGFRQAEVVALDRAIDRALDARLAEWRLGQLSERFESGGRGVGAVSSGSGDPGGVSYGVWQLSSRAGTAAAFVAAEGARWDAEFGGTMPGSAAFTAAWKRIAAREPEAFAEAQHGFIRRTHYRPAVDAVRRRTGLDLDTRHPAVRDVTWSIAVQHGGAADILVAAVAAADAGLDRRATAYDRRLVDAAYDQRSAYVLRVAARSSAGVRRTLENMARSRYPAEHAAALAMLEDAAVPA
jgi:hypothetical protein